MSTNPSIIIGSTNSSKEGATLKILMNKIPNSNSSISQPRDTESIQQQSYNVFGRIGA